MRRYIEERLKNKIMIDTEDLAQAVEDEDQGAVEVPVREAATLREAAPSALRLLGGGMSRSNPVRRF